MAVTHRGRISGALGELSPTVHSPHSFLTVEINDGQQVLLKVHKIANYILNLASVELFYLVTQF